MTESIYILTSSQMGLRRKLDITSNNLANLNTSGFQKEKIDFKEFVADSKSNKEEDRSYVEEKGTYSDISQGSFTKTDSQFDFAINGEGYFAVMDPDSNEIQYTRSGNFTMSNQGNIVTQDGFLVLAEGNAPINIPEGSGEIIVSSDGTMSTENGLLLGRLAAYNTNNPELMERAGGTRFKTDAEMVEVDNATIVQGMREDSNVNPIEEITSLIEVQRAYERNSKFIDSEDKRIEGLISKISQKV